MTANERYSRVAVVQSYVTVLADGFNYNLNCPCYSKRNCTQKKYADRAAANYARVVFETAIAKGV